MMFCETLLGKYCFKVFTEYPQAFLVFNLSFFSRIIVFYLAKVKMRHVPCWSERSGIHSRMRSTLDATNHSHGPVFLLFYGSTGKRETFAVFIEKSVLWDSPSLVVLPTRSFPFWQTARKNQAWKCHTLRQNRASPTDTKSIHTLTPTSCSGNVLEKLTVPQIGKKIPSCFGTRRFITVFTKSHLLSLSWAIWGTLQNVSVRIARFRARVRNRDLSNTK
jgi:hypothetical protein